MVTVKMIGPETSRFGPRRAEGFTLIELLVALAIIALLLTLAVPRYLGQLDASKEAVLRENLRTTRIVIDKFYGDNGRFPDSLRELVDRQYLKAIPIDPIAESDATWVLLPPAPGYDGRVGDLHSAAPGKARDGSPFAGW